MALYAFANAQGCVLTPSNDLNVSWQAYKTFSKIGVDGHFTSVKFTPNAKEAKTFKDLLVGSTVSIDISQISTNHAERDKTLVSMFFNQLKGKTIEGKIAKIEANKSEDGKKVLLNGTVEVSMTMNDKTLIIPMHYDYKENLFSAKGIIDLFDFEAKPALSSINKSCYDLHQGKTWNDVSISFSTVITATDCHSEMSALDANETNVTQ